MALEGAFTKIDGAFPLVIGASTGIGFEIANMSSAKTLI
jgi:hypothetical protein